MVNQEAWCSNPVELVFSESELLQYNEELYLKQLFPIFLVSLKFKHDLLKKIKKLRVCSVSKRFDNRSRFFMITLTFCLNLLSHKNFKIWQISINILSVFVVIIVTKKSICYIQDEAIMFTYQLSSRMSKVSP
jgi:hypothetical protein